MALICLRVLFLDRDVPENNSSSVPASPSDKTSQHPSKTLEWQEFEKAMEILGVPVDEVAQEGFGSSWSAKTFQRTVLVDGLEADVRHAQERINKLKQQEALLSVEVRNLSAVKAELDERVGLLVQRSAELLQMKEANMDDRGARMIDSENSLFDDVDSS